MVTYLNESDIRALGFDWQQCIDTIERSCRLLNENAFCQPVKPYLHFGENSNRIIAMPAYLGGSAGCAGIKWIASFPGNIKIGKPRANSVTILNDAGTGEPYCIINTSLISVIRTVSVSGAMIKKYLSVFPGKKMKVGVVGLGPIGQHHIRMCLEHFGKNISAIKTFDIQDTGARWENEKVTRCSSWEEAYEDADCFITCTVSEQRYIDRPPGAGSLHLNVSLRDYREEMYTYFRNGIIVDNWEEVCRKNTDIELFSKKFGLRKEQTVTMAEVICNDQLNGFEPGTALFFNPMGMAVFDIAIADQYYRLAQRAGLGNILE